MKLTGSPQKLPLRTMTRRRCPPREVAEVEHQGGEVVYDQGRRRKESEDRGPELRGRESRG